MISTEKPVSRARAVSMPKEGVNCFVNLAKRIVHIH